MVSGRQDGRGKTGRGREDILLVTAVFLLALSVYAGTLNHELVWDDKGVLEHIGSITKEGGLKAVLTSQFATHVEDGYVSGFYRPVPMASLWLDTLYATLIPFQYHLVNILLHGINTVLVFLVMGMLATRFAAVTGSVIFAVHPIHSESVSFVSGRTDLWATVFILVAVFLWLRIRKGQSERVTVEKWVSLGAFLMACLSKEVAYVMPAVLLIWDAVSPEGERGERPTFWTRNRFWIYGWLMSLSLVAVGRFIVFGPALGLIHSEGFQIQSVADIVILIKAFLIYLRLLILPWPLKVFYSLNELVITGAGFLAVMVFFFLIAAAYRRSGKGITVPAVVWITVFLLPVLLINLRDGALLAERFLYLPSVGFCLLAGVLAETWPKNRNVVLSVLGFLLVLMILGTGIQNRVWKNEITLFTELTRVSPMMGDGYYNLGNALSAKGKDLEALQAYHRAVEIDSKHYRAYFNMGNSLWKLKQREEAAEAYRETVRIEPTLVVAYVNLGSVYLEMKEYGQSIQTYREGLRYDPRDLSLNVGLILAYLESDDRPAAEQYYQLLKGKYPDLARLIGNLIAGYPGGT